MDTAGLSGFSSTLKSETAKAVKDVQPELTDLSEMAGKATAALSSMGVSVPSMVLPLIQGITFALDAFTTSQSEAIASSSALAAELGTLSSDITAIQNSLKSTGDRIQELTGKKSLSLIEQSELEKLKAVNTELERRLHTQSALEAAARQEASDAASTVVSHRSYINGIGTGGSIGSGKKLDAVEYSAEKLREVKKYDGLILEAEHAQDKKSAETYKAMRQEANAKLAETIKLLNIQNTLMLDSDPNKERTQNILNDYAAMYREKMADFDEKFNSDISDSDKRQISAAAQAGTLDADMLSQYGKLCTLLDTIGISAQEAAVHLNAVAESDPLRDFSPEATVKNVEALAEPINLLQDALSEFRSAGSASADTLASIVGNSALSELSGLDEFIRTLSDSKSTMTDVQEAAGSLASELLFNSDAFQNVNASNKDLLASLLESIGITNAAELSNQAYAAALAEAKLESIDLSEATVSEISQLMAEVGASASSAQAIAAYVLKKKMAKAENLTSLLLDESKGFLTLAKAAGISAQAIGKAEAVKKNMAKSLSAGKPGAGTALSAAFHAMELADAQKQIESELNDLLSTTFNLKQPSAPASSGSGAKPYAAPSTDTWKEAFEREYAEIRHLREMDLLNAAEYYARLAKLNNAYFKDRPQYLDDYRRYEEEIYKGGKELFEEKLALSQHYIEDKNFYDNWGADSEIDAWLRVQKYTQEYYDQGLINQKKYTEQYCANQKKIFDLQEKELEEMQERRRTALKEQQGGLQDIIDMTAALIKKEKNDQIDALEDEITAYKNLIKAKKESLQLAEREASYQEKVNGFVGDISRLQQQADLLALDDSREAQAQRVELLQQIADKQKELNDFQHEDAVDKAQDALDRQLDAFTKEKDEEIQKLKAYLSKSGLLVQAAMDRIDADGDALYQDLVRWNMEYGDGITQTVTSAWETARAALDEYGKTLDAVKKLQSELKAPDKATSSEEKRISEAEKDDIIQKMVKNSQLWAASSSDAERKTLSDMNKALGDKLKKGYDEKIFYESATGIWWLDREKKIRLFHDGLGSGIVGGQYTPQQNETYALLKKGEFVLNDNDQLQLSSRLKTAELFGKLVQTSAASKADYVPGNNSVQVTVTSPITIQGSVTKEMQPELEKLGSKISGNAVRAISQAFEKRGYTQLPALNK